MNHPCRQDCPDRNAECHAICEKWKAYETERNREYERVKKEREKSQALYQIERDRKRDIALGKMRRRRSKRQNNFKRI